MHKNQTITARKAAMNFVADFMHEINDKDIKFKEIATFTIAVPLAGLTMSYLCRPIFWEK